MFCICIDDIFRKDLRKPGYTDSMSKFKSQGQGLKKRNESQHIYSQPFSA